jgi:hypothetical protein
MGKSVSLPKWLDRVANLIERSDSDRSIGGYG